MRKLERRAVICLLCAAMLVLGLGLFVTRFVIHGDSWASYPANQHMYKDGNLTRGMIYDANGILLAENTKDGIKYNSDAAIRKATVHTVGDKNRSIENSAETVFQSRLAGYNLITGTYSSSNRKLYLTIDANICKTANEALAGRSGTVGVYNYETGDIICLVSSPNFDPLYPPSLDGSDTSGLYINRFFSSAVVPGSIFKLVTTAAAIDNLSNLDSWSYYCDGSAEYGPDKINCTSAHGNLDFEDALAVSCNGAFAQIAMDLGADTLSDYVSLLKLNTALDVNGITTAKGSFDFPSDNQVLLGWSGIGQSKDLVNPCSYLAYVGAIANGGEAASPRIISKIKGKNSLSDISFDAGTTGELLKSSTASKLQEMMKYNVEKTYGTSSFPGLDIYAKSGTAEVGGNKAPNSWFTGFIKNDDYPYAFIVLIENGGSGSQFAGSVANTVLQKIVSTDSAKSDK